MKKGMCKKIQVLISCLWLVSGPPKSGHFFERFTMDLVWESFSSRNYSIEPHVFYFLTVFHMVWKNQGSCESWLVGFGVSRRSKIQKISATIFFFALLSCHYGFTNYSEILIFAFSIPYLEEFQPVKY